MDIFSQYSQTSHIPDPRSDPQPEFNPTIPLDVLPHEKIYSIQVGDKLFRLSGASLSSDCPSYFTTYFRQPEKESNTLFIDRSPKVFDKIYQHLQGYHINIEDEFEFIYLFSDSFYFNLPRLKSLLTKNDIFARVGDKTFRFSPKLFGNKGDYPNYFTINYDTMLQDNTNIIESRNLIRPPPQLPPVSHRSGLLFRDLIDYLQGNEDVVKSEQHRKLLIRECRYYRFLNLEQKLTNSVVSLNPFSRTEQILMNVWDLKKEGFYHPNPQDLSQQVCLKYKKPFVDEPYRDLVIQIESEECSLIVNRSTKVIAFKMVGFTARRFANLFAQYNEKMLIEQEDNGGISIRFITDITNCHCVINNLEMKNNWLVNLFEGDTNVSGNFIDLKVLKSQWKLLFRGDQYMIYGVKMEGITDELAWHKGTKFS